MKKWNQQWKVNLIDRNNPDWKDLAEGFPKHLSQMEKLEILFGREKI